MWGDDSDEDEEPQQVEEKTKEVVKGPEETGTKSMDTTVKTEELTEEQKAEAATKIQAVQRGKAVRQKMQAREEAATKFQAVQRGKVTRETMKQEDVDDSNAQKETTKPKPSPATPRRQQASKETKRSPCQMSVRSDGTYDTYTVSHRDRTTEQSKHGQARIKQRVLEAHSYELHKKSCLRRLKLPLGIPSIPIIVVMGDLSSLDDDPQRKMLDYFSQGIPTRSCKC